MDRFDQKFPISSFTKICHVGAELIHADGLDVTEIKSAFHVYDNASSGYFLPTFPDNLWILGPWVTDCYVVP